MLTLEFLKPISLSNKMRIGPNSDGGYVVYKPSLNNIDLLITYGVGWDINFEIDYYNLTGKKILMYDPTMFGDKAIDKAYCSKLVKKCKINSFLKYVLNIYRWKKQFKILSEYDILFYNEGIACKASKKYDTFCNQLIKNDIRTDHILLKIDIEGNEYLIFNDADFIDNLNLVDQLIVEFHDLKNRLRSLESIINELNKQFYIAHIHGNNYSGGFYVYREFSDIYFPDVVEMTFVRKTCVLNGDILQQEFDYPTQGLDHPNCFWSNDFDKLLFS